MTNIKTLKFRAWDKTKNEIHDVLVIDYLNEFIDLTYENIERRFDEVELMQYTCFKDKNNVEIYEGDIVDKGVQFKNIYRYGVIKRAFGYDDMGYETKAFTGWIVNDGCELVHIHGNCEVIGNVYENPELLKKVK